MCVAVRANAAIRRSSRLCDPRAGRGSPSSMGRSYAGIERGRTPRLGWAETYVICPADMPSVVHRCLATTGIASSTTDERKTEATAMILVLGATGQLGTPLIENLSRAGAKFRAVAHTEESAAKIDLPGADVVVADVTQAESLGEHMLGISKLFLLTHAAPDQLQVQN